VQLRRFTRVALDAILVEPGFCTARKHWKSLAHVCGGKKILKLS